SETIAIHGGYEIDPTTKAVTVPIYQTVAYAFDSVDHGAALFNLEAEGYRYTRIGNPTTAVLERRVAALEGGVDALCVSSGQAAVHYATANLTELGSNLVSVPQLYGTTHTLFAHLLPHQGVPVRFAASDAAAFRARSTPSAFRCSASPTRRTTTWSTPTITKRRRISGAAAASISGRPARCCRRSAPFCCCRASRRWRCGSNVTSRTGGASR